VSQTHKATLEKANAAVGSGDHEGFLSFCTEDTKWTFVEGREETLAPLSDGELVMQVETLCAEA